MPYSSIVPESHETHGTSPLSESDIIQLRVSCIMPAGMFFVSAPCLLNKGREEQGERRVAPPPPCTTTVITTTAANRLLLWLLARICWRRRQWHPTPVLLPGKSHGRRSLVGCRPWGRTETGTPEQLHFHFSRSCIGEGSGYPLQCSCLENPRDGGAWWAAVHGVAQSWTRLKQLSSRIFGGVSCLLGFILSISIYYSFNLCNNLIK